MAETLSASTQKLRIRLVCAEEEVASQDQAFCYGAVAIEESIEIDSIGRGGAIRTPDPLRPRQ